LARVSGKVETGPPGGPSEIGTMVEGNPRLRSSSLLGSGARSDVHIKIDSQAGSRGGKGPRMRKKKHAGDRETDRGGQHRLKMVGSNWAVGSTIVNKRKKRKAAGAYIKGKRRLRSLECLPALYWWDRRGRKGEDGPGSRRGTGRGGRQRHGKQRPIGWQSATSTNSPAPTTTSEVFGTRKWGSSRTK